ncbi:HNH endonuclease [Marmoricola endophyticus]|uniref:HNH endonuclease n=1 Tax=Marmoricola endophyticus TaxID=2040280 RepID=A0A917BMY3_9ACTN|nr:DUF222 domain-containing protein [Marmoricola endophyticus]GGF46928.1 HNH endonuclease [Marmoricola endophyticus]
MLACVADAVEDAEVVELLGELESLTNTIAAGQARLAVRLRELRVAQRGHLPAPQRARGVGAEVGLARRESPHRGAQHLSLGWVLVRELPHTLAAMQSGRCSEWAATILARSTACLSRDDRRVVDEQLMADPATTEGWGARRLGAEADALAYRLDPEAALRRRERAVADRHVSLRPVPGVEGAGMTRLSALLPLADGVAVIASLGAAAEAVRHTGDARSRGQVMADTLVNRLLGRIGETGEPVVGVSVDVVVSDAALLNTDGPAGDQPGWIDGVPLPAETVRELIARAGEHGLSSLRRLYASPATGQLVAMDARSRCFPKGLAMFLEHRDRTCRTPYCDAPIRHHDHLEAFLTVGATSAANGQGLCEACNYARQSPDHGPPPARAPSPPRPLRPSAPLPRFTIDLDWRHAA